jgi:hypothetical protein
MAKVTKSAKDLFDVVRRIGRIHTLTALEQKDIAESAMKWVGDNCCPIQVFGLEALKDAIEDEPVLENFEPEVTNVED